MAIGDNNEKYYAPTYRPTTYASDEYANQNYGDDGYWQGDYYDPDAPKKSSFEQTVQDTVQQEMKKREGSEGGKRAEREFDLAASEQSKAHNYSRENNFGFEDIGMVGDIAGAVGKVFSGPVGMALGAPNRLDSISQNISIDNARKALGLPGLTNTQKLGGVVSSRKGVVANVTINDQPYTVTFDPNPKVKTEITPEEALKKSIDVGVPAVEVSPVEAPEKPGVIGNAIRAAKEALTGVKEAPVKDDKISQPAAPSTPSLGTAPAATPGYNPDNQQQVDAATRQNVSMNVQPDNPASIAASTPATPSAPNAVGGYLGGVAPSTNADRSQLASYKEGTLATPSVKDVSYDPDMGTVTGATPTGRTRNVAPNQNVTQGLANTVRDVLGPEYGVSLTSGTYTDTIAHNVEEARVEAAAEADAKGLTGRARQDHIADAVEGAKGTGSARHSTTLAGDYAVTHTDPVTGKTTQVTDRDKLGKVANAAVAAGKSVGFGATGGYMGGTVMHVDDTRPTNPNTWGGFAFSESPQAAAQQRAAMANYSGIGVPGTREMALQSMETPQDQLSNIQAGVTSAIAQPSFDVPSVEAPAVAENPTIDSMSNMTAASTPGVTSGITSQSLSSLNEGYTPGTAMSPANFSAVGMGYQYSPEQVKDMSYAIAGELGPTTLKGLVDQNPAAVNETAAVLGTIDNRVNAVANVGYKDPLGQALTAYDSVTKGFAATNTARNYAQYGPTVQDTVKGLLDGTISAQNPAQQTTHYANMSEVSPSWGKTQSFKDTQTQVGAHTFGTPDKSMRASVSSYGTAYGPNAATSLSGISGQTHTPGAMYGAETTTAGTPGGYAAAGTNALGGGLALGGGYVSGDTSSTTEGSTNSGLGGTSSSANGNTSGSGDSGSSSSGNGNSAGSGGDRGGSDGAGSSGSSGGSSGGLGGRGGDDDHDGGDGRGR